MLRILLLVGAEDRNRTGTEISFRRILSPLRLPVPPPRHKIWRRHPDLNWGIEVLQTSALPLGYVADIMERKTRFELATLALARRCSTAELLPHTWCLRTESNCRHEDFQSSALPTELPRHKQRTMLSRAAGQTENIRESLSSERSEEHPLPVRKEWRP